MTTRNEQLETLLKASIELKEFFLNKVNYGASFLDTESISVLNNFYIALNDLQEKESD